MSEKINVIIALKEQERKLLAQANTIREAITILQERLNISDSEIANECRRFKIFN